MRRSIAAAAVQSSPRFRAAAVDVMRGCFASTPGQGELIVLGGETDVVAPVGQDPHRPVEMADVRHPVQDEQNAHLASRLALTLLAL